MPGYVKPPANGKFSGASEFTPSTSSQTPLTIKAASGQTANILEVENSSGTNLAYVKSNGRVVSDNITAMSRLSVNYDGDPENPNFEIKKDFSESMVRLGSVTYQDVGIETYNNVRLRIDKNGPITMPGQPSFWAWRTSSTSAGNVIVCNNTQHNTGLSYNTSNGRFTAPISGKYLFSINSIGNTSGTTRIHPRLNGSQNPFGLTGFQLRTINTTNYGDGSLTFIWNLNANDYVDLYVSENTAYSDTSGYMNWSGHLLD